MEKVAKICYIFDMKEFLLLRRILLITAVLSLTAFPIHAQGFFSNISWFAEVSVLLFPEDNGMESGPMPILPSPGLGASYRFNNMFRLESTLDFYMAIYGYSDELGRAVPQEVEHRSAQVIGSILGIQTAGYFNFFSFLTLRAFAGLTADLRIVMVAFDLGPDDGDASKQTDSVRDYFWSQGRWLFPVLGVGADFLIDRNFRLGIDLRVWAPLYRLWSGEDLPAIEGWRFGGGLRLGFR